MSEEDLKSSHMKITYQVAQLAFLMSAIIVFVAIWMSIKATTEH